MNITRARVGVLMSPAIPLWSGTVVSSTGADSFSLTVSPKTGIVAGMVGLAVDAGGELVRIKAVDTSGVNAVLSLAENGVSSGVGGGFEAGATVNIYNVRYPMPKFQRITTNVVTVTVESGGANPFGAWRFSSTGGYSTIWWWIRDTDAKLILYNDASNEDDSKIAAGKVAGAGTITLEAKNASGVGGTVVVADATPGSFGYVTISPFSLTKDYDITYTSLGADDTARSKAVQAPAPIVNPEAAYIAINTNIVFSAAGSFATYDGWNAGARAPATIGATGYVWDAGTDGTIVSGQNSNTLTVKWSSAGFRYLKLTVTDSNSVTAVRYIPVWVASVAFTSVSKCDLSWRLGEGWSANLEFKAPPTMLRHSLVAVIDMDTTEILFCGYVWPETFSYDFEKTTLSFTAYTALAFLKNCYYYPFRTSGVKGDPENSYTHGWSDFDMLSVPRGVYFLLRWHTNFLELANAQFDVRAAVAPSALAAENRLEYIRDFTAGTLLDQLNVVAKSAMYSVYGLRLGGLEVIPDLLYGSEITGVIAETGVNSDTLTLDLTTPNIVAPVSYEMGTPTLSDARLSGFYYDASLNFYPIVVRAPNHPGAYGRPAEVGNLIANGPGYAELLRWAGRHIGLSNLARKYTLRSLVDVDPKTYKMIDIPDPANPPAQIRIVVEDEVLQLDAEALAWNLKIGGRTFGTTADAVVEPPNPTPTVPPVITPIPPEPVPEVEYVTLAMDNAHLGMSLDFYTAASPTWTNLSTGAMAAAIAAGAHFQNVALSITGECWVLTGLDDESTNGIWYCASILAPSPSFELVLSHDAAQVLDGGTLEMTALGCSDLGVAYTTSLGYYSYLYGTTAGTFVKVTPVPIPTGVSQYAICSGTSVRLALGAGGVGAWGVREIADAVNTYVLLVNNEQPEPTHVSVGFAIHTGSLFSYVDDGGFQIPTLVVAGVERFLVSDGVNALTVRTADGYLMNGAAALATPLAAFGAARDFGGCAIGPSGYGELIACARDSVASNFLAMRSVAGVWSVRDGDWVAKCGAWSGWDGAGHNLPMLVTAVIA